MRCGEAWPSAGTQGHGAGKLSDQPSWRPSHPPSPTRPLLLPSPLSPCLCLPCPSLLISQGPFPLRCLSLVTGSSASYLRPHQQPSEPWAPAQGRPTAVVPQALSAPALDFQAEASSRPGPVTWGRLGQSLSVANVAPGGLACVPDVVPEGAETPCSL